MLTNCKDCKFHAEYNCAVNPNYLAAFNQLQELDKIQRETIAPLMESCRDWQESEELQVLDASIQLTLRAWKQIAQSSSYAPDIEPLVQKARELTGYTPTVNDIPF